MCRQAICLSTTVSLVLGNFWKHTSPSVPLFPYLPIFLQPMLTVFLVSLDSVNIINPSGRANLVRIEKHARKSI